MSIAIDFINASTVVTNEEAAKVVAALQIQVTQHFAPAWGYGADLKFIVDGVTARPQAWQVVILDNSDQAGALGYHDLTSDGLPIGKVFAKTDKDNGLSWSVTASHELLEMLGDPGINLTVLRETLGQLWAYENCDACEADELGYLIGDVLVSDFVYPSWFEEFWGENDTQFDYCKKIQRPFQLLPGGYIGYFDIRGGNGWQQSYADSVPKYSMRAPVGSRRERRRTPRNEWKRGRK